MKKLMITFFLLLCIGFKVFSIDDFFTGSISAEGGTHITSASSFYPKLQPEAEVSVAGLIMFGPNFGSGISVSWLYAGSSGVEGGWTYPGFSGIEGGLEFLYFFAEPAPLSLTFDLLAGFYKYNLTPNYFFIPSVKLTPGWTFFKSDAVRMDAILPLKYYIRTNGILFSSAAAGLRISL